MTELAISVAMLVLALGLKLHVSHRWAVRDIQAAAHARATVSGIDFFGFDAAGRAMLQAICDEIRVEDRAACRWQDDGGPASPGSISEGRR